MVISKSPTNKSDIDCDIDDLVEDCSNSIANTLELLQSCTKLTIWPQQNES